MLIAPQLSLIINLLRFVVTRCAEYSTSSCPKSAWRGGDGIILRMQSIVALDIETTGLDPDRDVIIEIGALRFNGHRVEKEWSTLVNPGRRIPPFITQLTGITDQMVAKAPPLQAVLSDLSGFVGDSPILGQNIRFDLSFLRRQNILGYNDSLDTYELAAVLLPGAGRYSLGALAQALGVLLPATHRALDDARATHAVYLRLLEEAMQLPLSLLAEILRLAEKVEWGGYMPLHEVMRLRSREIVPAQNMGRIYDGPIFNRPAEHKSRRCSPVKIYARWTSMASPRFSSRVAYSRTISRATNTARSRLKCCAPSPRRFPNTATC